MSQYRSTKKLHSPKFLERRKKKIQILIFLSVLCLGTLAACIILLLRASFFQISHVLIEGSTLSSKESITGTVLSTLGGQRLGIVPRTNTFFYPKSDVKEALNENFKEIKNLIVKRSGFSGLRIMIEEKKPAAIVCAGFREDEIESNCYVSDEHGFVFGEMATSTISIESTQLLTHYYIPSEKGALPLGENFVKEELFKNLQKFVDGSLRGGLLPLGVLINENGEYEMYVNNKNSDSEITIYFDERSPFDKTLENLLVFWDTNVNKSTTTKAFDYINLRFGNTVYYSTQ